VKTNVEEVFPRYFSRNFAVSTLIFKSFIYLGWFLCMCMHDFSFFSSEYAFSHAIYWRTFLSLLCVYESDFCECNTVPEIMDVKREKGCLASKFCRFHPKVSWSYCVEMCGGAKWHTTLNSQEGRGKGKEKVIHVHT
jgi:hypothetical protein